MAKRPTKPEIKTAIRVAATLSDNLQDWLQKFSLVDGGTTEGKWVSRRVAALQKELSDYVRLRQEAIDRAQASVREVQQRLSVRQANRERLFAELDNLLDEGKEIIEEVQQQETAPVEENREAQPKEETPQAKVQAQDQQQPKKRGRPRKTPAKQEPPAQEEKKAAAPKKRGRPRKVA